MSVPAISHSYPGPTAAIPMCHDRLRVVRLWAVCEHHHLWILLHARREINGWVVGLEGRSTLSLCSERALNLAPAPSRAQT